MRDKLLHAETCAMIVIVAALFINVWWAGLLGLAAGIGKEVWDKYHNGVPSWCDLLADAVGITAGMVISWLSLVLFV
ncbi:MAG: hypothetical protein IKR30_06280 [Bacteroidales bacterium]|nr:hypothetical protein [Bacteroidales bacterium]